ncbi:phosphotransferase KptA/Tpt1 [Hesseltinella vesiculosa]|uniref:2'-phosphotransferase n=1 Tax=Hesseltinella vesiculosa TaxID=101127 RepID=A0A1X2GF74_9FUNG|nr:phosphotransferase KptA/Tpt1 [Hesseltinella vesiculosa]
MDKKEEVRLSKLISYILRHGAVKEKLELLPDGYIRVDDLLARPKLKGVSLAMMQHLVDNNDKQRFAMIKDEQGQWLIRANQGHSLRQVHVDMEPLTTALATVIHGTTLDKWVKIQATGGLSRMNRNHIHCAAGLPEDAEVKSGIRASCNVLIYIDMTKALQDGIQFYRSSNGVILTDGVQGKLALAYFSKVVDRQGNPIDTTK